MSDRSAVHASFTIERTYPASVERVYNAFADPETKAKWFAGPEGWIQGRKEFDFRVGGREHDEGGPPGGFYSIFDSVYYEIVPNERLIYAYEMHVDGRRNSVSVASIEFFASGKGTKLVLSESGIFLDGLDKASMREDGTKGLLDQLGKVLAA